MVVRFVCLAACLTIVGRDYALGHTGPMALALPVSRIAVDGDVSDWPSDFPSYSIDPEHSSADDFKGRFRVGFDQSNHCLYVAVEVTDDRVVLEGSVGKASDAQDSCEIYVDVVHGQSRSMASGFFYRRAYGAYPGPREAFEKSHLQADAAHAARAAKNGHVVYEWKIDLRRLSGAKASPSVGSVIGFDLVYFDRDDNQTVAFHLWGPSTKNRTDDSLQLADVLITNRPARFGKLSGRLSWTSDDNPSQQAFPHVSAQSLDNPALRVQVSCDSSGKFQATLPEGSYAISPVDAAELRVKNVVPLKVKAEAHITTEAGVLKIARQDPPPITTRIGVLRQPGSIDKKALTRVIKDQMEHWQIPGASIAVIKDAKLVYARVFGVKDVMTDEPVTDDTLFEACSLTKPLFAFAVNRLAERGVIDLDKPLSEYSTDSVRVEDVRADERLKMITARHVLAHRSGFPNWRNDRLTIDFTPGTKVGYSGEAFEYLGEVVARVTRKSVDEILRDEAFAPLNTTSASATCDDEVASKSATGHDAVRPLEKWMPKSPIVSASLHVTARDYAKFLLALLHRSAMSDRQWSEMLLPRFTDDTSPTDKRYGLGVGVESSPYGTLISHSGLNPGFHCYFAVYDEPKFGFVYFINNQKGGDFHNALETYLVTGMNDVNRHDAR